MRYFHFYFLRSALVGPFFKSEQEKVWFMLRSVLRQLLFYFFLTTLVLI